MKKKFRDSLMKLVDSFANLLDFILTVLIFALLLYYVIFISFSVLAYLWNMAIPQMFFINKITWTQLFILSFTFSGLTGVYYSDFIKNAYKYFKKAFNEKKAGKELNLKQKIIVLFKLPLLIKTIFCIITTIILTILGVNYSWNVILPNLLCIELVKINYLQSAIFVFFANQAFGKPNNESITDFFNKKLDKEDKEDEYKTNVVECNESKKDDDKDFSNN